MKASWVLSRVNLVPLIGFDASSRNLALGISSGKLATCVTFEWLRHATHAPQDPCCASKPAGR